MIKGVNLGNWLVLEKWMSPTLFAGTDAEDETQLCLDLGEEAKRERLKVHRDSYITERDFAYLANHGIEAVRIPVPFFLFGDYEPFVGCVDYLDRAFFWAEQYGLQVLIDVHTAPGSQNGFDNGGRCGVCTWHRSPERVEFILDLLERLTTRYGAHPALWGIEVLNEPISPELWELIDIPTRYPAADPVEAEGSEPVPTDLLKAFYLDAYQRIRARSNDVTVVFHDGFRLRELAEFFAQSGFERFVVDTHLYLMVHTLTDGDDDLDGYLGYVDDHMAATVREMTGRLPLIVGEWCLDTSSSKVHSMTRPDRQSYYRALAEAQLSVWANTSGWFFWNYKLAVDGPELDGWDFGKSVELGYLDVG